MEQIVSPLDEQSVLERAEPNVVCEESLGILLGEVGESCQGAHHPLRIEQETGFATLGIDLLRGQVGRAAVLGLQVSLPIRRPVEILDWGAAKLDPDLLVRAENGFEGERPLAGFGANLRAPEGDERGNQRQERSDSLHDSALRGHLNPAVRYPTGEVALAV